MAGGAEFKKQQNVVQIKSAQPQIVIEDDVVKVIAIVTEGPPGPPGPAGSAYWAAMSIDAPGTYVISAQSSGLQIEVDCSAGPVTIQLPNSNLMLGTDLRIIKLDDTDNILTVKAATGQTISGQSDFTDFVQWACMQINARTNLWRRV